MTRTYTQQEVTTMLQQAIEFGERQSFQAYQNVQVITRIACIRWASGGFLAGAAFVALWQRFAQ